MKHPIIYLICPLAAALSIPALHAETPVAPSARFLYMSTPDGAQKQGSSEPGILIFDIDKDHRFVRRIDLPIFREGLRGFTGCTATKCLYYSTTGGTLGCFDLVTEKVKWQSKFKQGCDRSCITPDGKRIYAPTGWWWQSDRDGFIVVDAATGKEIERIAVNKRAHNSIASLDGKYVYLGTQVTLTQFRASDGKVLQTISPVGESGVFPYTVNSANTRAYVCLGKHAGFDIVDLETGTVTDRVFATDPTTGKKIKHRTHGAGMNPDETELWISDQAGRKLFIFDLTQSPPAPKGHVDLSMGGHGWITFSLDGAYAYSHTPDIFDVRTRRKVASLAGPDGKSFASSKFIEVQFVDGQVSRISNEFGLGRVNEK
jgi:outer membrane protein assembly factor BamB